MHRIPFSHLRDTFHTPAIWQTLGPCQGIYTLPELLERVSAGKILRKKRPATYRSASISKSSHLQWRIIIKKMVPYLDVISFFVSKPSTFNSPNSKYLKIFRFNLIDCMCFWDKWNAWIIQYSTKSMVVFFFLENKLKITITTDTTIYCTGNKFLKTIMFYWVIFYCFQHI